MAQLQLKRENYKGAAQSLEHALSHNFEVRESVLYHLLKARISEKLGDLDEAQKILDSAMALPGIRQVSLYTYPPLRSNACFYSQ